MNIYIKLSNELVKRLKYKNINKQIVMNFTSETFDFSNEKMQHPIILVLNNH